VKMRQIRNPGSPLGEGTRDLEVVNWAGRP